MEKRLIVISNILPSASILFLMATGTVMRWILPQGSGGSGHGAVLGRGRHLLEGHHVTFVWILALHLIMNWSWIQHTYFAKKTQAQPQA